MVRYRWARRWFWGVWPAAWPARAKGAIGSAAAGKLVVARGEALLAACACRGAPVSSGVPPGMRPVVRCFGRVVALLTALASSVVTSEWSKARRSAMRLVWPAALAGG